MRSDGSLTLTLTRTQAVAIVNSTVPERCVTLVKMAINQVWNPKDKILRLALSTLRNIIGVGAATKVNV